MEFPSEHFIENLYNSELVTDIPSSKAYQEIIGEYNDLFDTIEDKELKSKLEKLNEIRNNLYFANDKEIFKLRFFNGY